jgi:hypothetical protein
MQAFFTLLNIPVVVPVAFGLIFRRVPKWAAVGSIAWGLIVGVTARYALGWDIGPQVYLAFALSFGIFVSSYWLGKLYLSRKVMVALLSVAVAIGAGALFLNTFVSDPTEMQRALAVGSALCLGASLYLFARLFSRETEAEREAVEAFFRKLDTPVDVAKEVFGAGKKQVSTFPLVGGTTVVMGLLLSLIFFTEMSASESLVLGVIIAVLMVFGVLMWYFGKKAEIKSAQEYLESK